MTWLATVDGEKVHLDGALVTRTYEGFLEGRVTDKVNALALTHATERVEAAFHAAPIHVVPSALTEGRYPDWLVAFSLLNYEGIDGSHASHLTLCGFTEDPHTRPLREMAERLVASVQWRTLARGFEW